MDVFGYGMESSLRSSVRLWSVIWVRGALTVAVPGRQEGTCSLLFESQISCRSLVALRTGYWTEVSVEPRYG